MMTRTKTRVVTVGGGTGLSSMLRGLKAYFSDITAVVTVTDDGGGSGVLRRELHMPPPGDIRNCIQALANAEPVMQEVLDYRFREGTLAGQNLGNLILAALYDTTPSFDAAVKKLGKVLAITGQVLPVTNGNVVLEARFGDGAIIRGETAITHYKRITDAVIDEIMLSPARPAALPAVLEAITGADMIVLGPGSLYTSVIPNLLVDGVAAAIRDSRAVKVYVMNIMTQDGETEGYSAARHVQALQKHGGGELFRYVLLNDREIPGAVAGKYREENAAPIRSDGSELRAMGLTPVFAPVAAWENGLVRHDPAALAAALRGLYYKLAATRTAKWDDRA